MVDTLATAVAAVEGARKFKLKKINKMNRKYIKILKRKKEEKNKKKIVIIWCWFSRMSSGCGRAFIRCFDVNSAPTGGRLQVALKHGNRSFPSGLLR